MSSYGLGRRSLLASATGAAALATLGAAPAAKARYTRYNVTSPEGRQMLASYARGISVMLSLPAENPHNWFRNAFIHLMDCPHGNWWFYVWHRGYVGLFEQTIRKLSGDPNFAMPFWDWTELPQIPADMFSGVLTPVTGSYYPYTRDLPTFSNFMVPAMLTYWNRLTAAQRLQQSQRGVNSFDDLWASVTGAGVPGNMAFATTGRARYLTAGNPRLDPATTYDCSRGVILGGLGPTSFYASSAPEKYRPALSFNSVKTASHTVQPSGATWFSILEGMPHNNVHNNIGGVPYWNPGPYGNMTNFLSPVDPVFFLHHANMDRLWDVWTRKQQSLGLSALPEQADLNPFFNEPFRFFVNANGDYLTNSAAGNYFLMSTFDYQYAPGTGEELIRPSGAKSALPGNGLIALGDVRGNAGSITLPRLTAPSRLVAAITVARPQAGQSRSFDVLIDAPPGVTQAEPGSPYFGGRIAFFGPSMAGMAGMEPDATFLVPLPESGSGGRLRALAQSQAETKLSIQVVPVGATAPAPVLSAVSIQAL